MHKYNKIRGIMRAKQGSPIPKFLHPAGALNLGGATSFNIIGGKYYINGIEVTKELYDSAKIQKEQLMNNFGKDTLGEDTFNNLKNRLADTESTLINLHSKGSIQAESQKDATDTPLFTPLLSSKTDIDKNNRYKLLLEDTLKLQNTLLINHNNTSDTDTKIDSEEYKEDEEKSSIFKNVGNSLIPGAKDFISKNGMSIANTGLDILGNSFNNVENSGGINTAFAVGDTIANGIGMVNPVFGLAAKGVMTAVKGINSLGGKRAKKFSVNQTTASQVGASYGGSMADITNAANKAGKKYGLFSGSSRRKANNLINKAEGQQDIMTDIANDALDMQAMAGNDFNYINYLFGINGGYDQRYMRAAKSGMKIQDRINFVKLKRVINNVINLDTKEIEWEPVIDDIVEEFKEGGIIEKTSDWEPIIDDIIDYWEPVIDDIEVYKEGGSIKEELETPEIEETNQKNLIPEGALHKNKHHMEHTEGLTLKGIPVIDNEGEQLAEIELDEIIFTLEVTKKLEEFYKDGSDEAAIEAGKLLVNEILFNTDDRTGLIAKCLEGGKL